MLKLLLRLDRHHLYTRPSKSGNIVAKIESCNKYVARMVTLAQRIDWETFNIMYLFA